MKWILCFICFMCAATCDAESTRAIFNPFWGNFDYITQASTNNFQAGSGMTVTCTNGICTFSASASSTNIFQIVSSSATGTDSTSSLSFVNTILTANITPQNSSHHVMIVVSGSCQVPGTSTPSYFRLTRNVQGIGALGLGDTHGHGTCYQAGGQSATQFFVAVDSPTTVSSTTYTVQFESGTSGQTVSFGQDSNTRSMWIVEVP